MHNDYVIRNEIKGGSLKGLSLYGGWNGYYDQQLGCIYDLDGSWDPKYDRKEPEFPYDVVREFDARFRTRLLFTLDDQFQDAVFRNIEKRCQTTAKVIASYFWQKYILKNLQSNRILFCRLKSAKDVKVGFC